MLKVAICVDFMGSGDSRPEDEIKNIIKEYTKLLGPNVEFYNIPCIYEESIQPGTNVILYDFGGLMPGTSLMEDNSRRLVQWAQDHTSALVVVISTHTFTGYVQPEMDDAGCSGLLNLICQDIWADDPIPKWFRDLNDIPYQPLAIKYDASLPLPPAKFFEPNTAFYVWMKYRYPITQTIYDIGAGVGHVAAGLREHGFLKVIAIDNWSREGSSKILITNATKFEYEPGSVILICRPCHGSFVEDVIQQTKKSWKKDIIYIGLLKNKVFDTGKYSRDFKRVGTAFGRDNEYIWVYDN